MASRASYLIGWCLLRGAGRAFRLDRIAAVRLKDEVAPERDVDALLDWVDETWTPEVATSLVEVCAQRVQEAAVAALVREGRREEADTLVAADELERLEQTGDLVGQAGASEGGRLASFAADVVLYARDAGRPAAGAAVAAYIAAHALAGGDKTVRTYAARFEVERGWQAEWLRGRLRL